MIVAIDGADAASHCALAANLAVLRARSAASLCLIDMDPGRHAWRWSCARNAAGQGPAVPSLPLATGAGGAEARLAQLAATYDDLLIHTCAADSRGALLSARTVLVPLAASGFDLDANYALVARLNNARMFNPSLKVLFVMVCANAGPTALEAARARLYVAHVMSATLADTVLHRPDADGGDHDYGQGRCLCDAETCDPEAAAELHALYDEVYARHSHAAI